MTPKWRPTSSQNRAQEPSKTLLEPGCRPKPFSEASWGVFGSPRNPKNHAPATMRAQFWLKSLIAPGAPKSSPKGSQNRSQKPPWRLQDGFKTRPKKGFDFGSNFKALFVDFGGPRGAGASNWLPKSLQICAKPIKKVAWRSLSTPREPSRLPGSGLGGPGQPKWEPRGPRAPQKLWKWWQNGVKMGSKTGPKWNQIRSALKC